MRLLNKKEQKLAHLMIKMPLFIDLQSKGSWAKLQGFTQELLGGLCVPAGPGSAGDSSRGTGGN